jgi:Zn finger protein HypA/HybF involved in hydrogenase expression
MVFQEKSIKCSDCGTTFSFGAGEQEFFQSKGFTNEPKRCPSCRQTRKTQRGNNSSYGNRREMFPTATL